MNKLYIPKNYVPKLDVYDTQKAISFIKQSFQEKLSSALRLKRVSAPLFVPENSGLNDNLSGKERPVSFDIPAVSANAQVVQSLAKWKRMALKEYRFYVGNGLYTDMNAIRRDEELDNIHSVYVDQWDWERVITANERTLEYLIDTVKSIVGAICDTNEELKRAFPVLDTKIERNVFVISSQELLELYPGRSSKEREYEITKKHGTVFIYGIGYALSDGNPHDQRAPDYDDWNLNGDILFYNEVLDRAFEISSMGIRVDEESLDRQLTYSKCDDRRALPFHRALLGGELPLTIGGGIGQSRLCMLMMGSAHIGEVQSSVWDNETLVGCRAAGIRLL